MADAVEEAAGRLYGLPLEDFTRERDATARELRRAKERDAAGAVAKLPKPSQASWAANQLARQRRELVDALLAAGDELRAAQDAAMTGGGAAELREATAAERKAVDALVHAAKELRPSGRAPTAATLDRLRTTLHAAAADDAVRAALAAGRLVEDAAGGGAWGLFGGAPGDDADRTAATERKPRRAGRAAAGEADVAERKPRRGSGKTEDDEATGATAEQREREAAERREREAAERAAREERRRLEAELREARADRKARERALARAEREAERAAERLEEARTEAQEARAELEAAREAANRARDDVARIEEQLD